MNAPSNIWIHPNVVVRLFTKTILSQKLIVTNEEISKIIRNKNLKISAEAWRAAMYLIALKKLNYKIDYYLQQNPKDPPDFYSIDLFTNNGVLRGYEREIEVFEYPNESKLSLEEEIHKKIFKSYSPKTVLVCHITKNNFKESLGGIRDMILKFKPKNEIWLVASANDGIHQIVANIFPNMIKVEIDILEIITAPIEHPFIQSSMGKSQSLEFIDTGKIALLKPNLDIIPADDNE